MSVAIETAKEQKADLVVFGELATCGYPPRDFLEFSDFIKLAKKSILELTKMSHGIGIVVGSPTVNPKVEGKDLFNSAYLLYDGEVVGA